MKTSPTTSNNINRQGREIIAEFKSKVGRTTKDNDILIFDRIGATNQKATDGTFKKGGLFRAASDSLFKKLFSYKASNKDVKDIFKTAGMNEKQIDIALANVNKASKARKLSGLSASAVEAELNRFRGISLPGTTST